MSGALLQSWLATNNSTVAFRGKSRTLHRAPVCQGPSGPDWLAISFGFWSGRALATGTAWAGLCLIHHHHSAANRRRFLHSALFTPHADACEAQIQRAHVAVLSCGRFIRAKGRVAFDTPAETEVIMRWSYR